MPQSTPFFICTYKRSVLVACFQSHWSAYD